MEPPTPTQVGHTRILALVGQLQDFRAAFTPLSPQPPAPTIEFEITDVHRLPSHLVIVRPNKPAIRAEFCAGWQEGDPLPMQAGIRFRVSPDNAGNSQDQQKQ
jgi:hypothetical protein